LANLWSVLLCLPNDPQCAVSYCVGRSMTRDEEVYPDPESFKPERFIKDGALNKEVRDPRDIVFGFGRRCGLHNVLSFKANPGLPLMP
jgi:hypothetical protein